MLITRDTASAVILSVRPSGPTSVPARMDSSVLARIATPAVPISSSPRTRLRSGSGRLLRGIPHAVFVAYWNAWPTPSPPYSPPMIPTVSPTAPPLIRRGRARSTPMTGNWCRAEASTFCCNGRSPASTKLSTVEPRSSSGKMATMP